MSQISTVQDASGIRECSYDSYGHMTKTLPLEPWKAPFRNNNALGRPAGYRLLLGTRTVQHSHLDYDSKGGMIGMNLEGLKSSFTWRYDPTSGFLNRLTYPNGMVRCNTYHPALNLVTAIGYRKGADGESATGHEYDYDALMRPIQRRDLWDAATPATIRDFTYNSRSELLEDRISRGGSFAYCYDNIGNRKTARELEEEVSYDANRLNQYADIAGGGKKILTPFTTPTATRPASRLQRASGKCPTTPTTAPSSSPARMAERPLPAATTTGEGASRRRSPSMGQYPATPGSCTGIICR